MTEEKNEIDQEVETFTDELSDEALDREVTDGRKYSGLSTPGGGCL